MYGHVGCIVRLVFIVVTSLVNARSCNNDRALTETGCMVHWLKGVWHRAVNVVNDDLESTALNIVEFFSLSFCVAYSTTLGRLI